MDNKDIPYTEEELQEIKEQYDLTDIQINHIRLMSPIVQRWWVDSLKYRDTHPDYSDADMTLPYPDDVSVFFFKPDDIE